MSFRSHSHPTHSANNRRRRLMLRQPGTDQSIPESDLSDTSEASSVIESSLPESSPSASHPPREKHGVRSISELLADETPVSWLFIGDSHTPHHAAEPQPWVTYPSLFSGAVRQNFVRSRDVFIDATYPGSRVSEVLAEFERRVLRFEPDICFLAMGTLEAESRHLDRFEHMISRLIRWTKRFGCQLVLQTPVCLPGLGDAELTRQLILVEAIRGITREQEVLLADHWEHWERAVSSDGVVDGWVDENTATPGPMGHRQLARRLIRDLHLPKQAPTTDHAASH